MEVQDQKSAAPQSTDKDCHCRQTVLDRHTNQVLTDSPLEHALPVSREVLEFISNVDYGRHIFTYPGSPFAIFWSFQQMHTMVRLSVADLQVVLARMTALSRPLVEISSVK